MNEEELPTSALAPVESVPPEQDAIFAALAPGVDLEDDSWPSRPRRRGIAMRLPTAVLVALVVAAGAFWAGAAVQKSAGSNSGLAAAAANIRSALRAGRGGGALFGGGASTLAPVAEGTLTAVVGNTLYLTTVSGSIVTVKLTRATTLTRETSATARSLVAGDTVVVRGTTASSGTVEATSITATAKGVAAAGAGTFGGFGGFGGSGGGTNGARAGSATGLGGSSGAGTPAASSGGTS